MNYLLFLFIALLPTFLFGQVSNWSQKPSIGVYYTPLIMERYSGSSGLDPNARIWEKTLNVTASVPISQKFRLGVQYFSVSTEVKNEPVDRSQLLGIAGQYNFSAKDRLGVYAELGYALGNFCPCGNAETYSSDTLNHFISFGVGVDYRLTRNFHLKAGFVNYSPIKKHNDVYNWTQPFIGLNYYFFKQYKTPIKSKATPKKEPKPKAEYSFFWNDSKKRVWNIGLTSAGMRATQHRPYSGQQEPLWRHLEFTVVPRLNYWVNQALMVGIQGTYYRYADNLSATTQFAEGWGAGVQARLYPMSVKNPKEFSAMRIGASGAWNLAPITGVEVHWSNFSSLEPDDIGDSWKYVDVQAYVGYAIAYKRLLNIFMGWGPAFELGSRPGNSLVRGSGLLGIEYHFTK